MSCALLGEPFDIHGGGMDLQFPHHENEIAQSEGASGGPFVNVWMHNGFLNIDNEKMSKSLGNFFTIQDVLRRFDGETVRFFMLRTHYRSPFNFSDQVLEETRTALKRLYTALEAAGAVPALPAIDWAEPRAAAFKTAMDDDFNTPGAVAVLFDLAAERQPRPARADAALLKALGGVLGILQQAPRDYLQGGAGLDEAAIQQRIEARARGQEGARLRAGRPHPRRTRGAGRGAEGFAAGHDLGQGLSMPDRDAAVPPARPALATPAYWDDACRHLARRDRVMKKLIPRFGEARLHSRGDAFTTLARSIVGQQISVKAAQSVWDRFAATVGGPAHAPAAGRGARAGHAARCAQPGCRRASASTCRTWRATSPSARRPRPTGWRWTTRPSSTELVAIRGIGRWTAEMFLIFHLMRPNVMPLDDLGLLKGISLNYFSGEPVSRAEAREVGEAWAPFRSVATWYIWRSLDPLPVDY